MIFGKLLLSPVNYGAEARALFARMTVAPNAQHKNAIDKLIKALQASGVWSRLDLLYLFAAHSDQAGYLNWKSTSFPFRLSSDETSAPSGTFTIDRGLSPNADAGPATFRLNTSGLKYQRDDAHLMMHLGNLVSSDTGVQWFDERGIAPITGLFTDPSLGRVLTTLSNSSASDGPYQSPSPDLTPAQLRANFITSRSSSAGGNQLYRNGSAVPTTAAKPSTGTLAALKMRITKASTPYAALSLGGSLTPAQSSAFAQAISAYMTRIGAPA